MNASDRTGPARWSLAALAAAAMSCLGGCAGPGEIEPSLIQRYQQSLAHYPKQRPNDQGPGLLQPLDGAEPAKVVQDPVLKLEGVEVSLDEAVRMALRNSMDIRLTSFDPLIAYQEAVRAAAAFDAVVFGSAFYNRAENPAGSLQPGPTGRTDTIPLEVGVRDHTVTGADLEAAWDLTRITNNAGGLVSPQARWESLLTLKATQPLLRGAGPAYNLAPRDVALLNTRAACAQFRQRVEDVVTQVQTGYWALVDARMEFVIQQELLDKTAETLERVRKRRDLDVTEVEVRQAEAAVETRRATLVRAKATIFDAQDQLVRLLSGQRLNLIGGSVIVPTTPLADSPLSVDPTDQLVSALQYSPLLEQARLNIAMADVRVSVARNETLPTLNLVGSVSPDGVGANPAKANADMLSFDFLTWAIGATIEQPLGNRAALATLRQRRFERLKALADMQNTADKIALNINQAIRQIRTTHEEAKAQQAAEDAARVQLRALDDTERIRGQLTPEFLQLKLQAQETLAGAQRAKIQALTNFNNAIAQLAQVKGTVLQQHNMRLGIEEGIDYRPGRETAWPEQTITPISVNYPTTVSASTTSAPSRP